MSANPIEFFEIFPWNENFDTGIEEIDEQHKNLVHILNRLAAHFANLSKPITLNTIFDELTDYADYHFTTEETIWNDRLGDDAWCTAHVKEHRLFTKQVVSLRKEEQHKPLDDVIRDIVSVLSQWLCFHILDADRRMAKALLAHESGASVEEAKAIADEFMSGSMSILVNTVLAMYDSISSRTIDLMREKVLRKRTEEALRASEERWNFVLQDEEEGIWDWNIEKGMKFSSAHDSPVIDLMLIDGNQDDVNDDDGIRIHPDDIKRVRTDLQNHLDGKTEFYTNKHRIRRRNSSWSWVMTRGKVVSRDEHGAALRMVGTHSDITKREIGSLIFSYGRQAIILIDANNKVVSINPAFCLTTGYSEAEIVGKHVDLLISDKDGDTSYDAILASLESTGRWEGEICSKRQDGELFPASMNITSIKATEDLVDHYIAQLTDISDRKQIEKSLQQSQKMDAIGLVTGGISHDFNNLLGIILGNVELIESQINPDDKIYESLQDIERAGQRGAKLTKQLLNFSRRHSDEVVPTDLNHVISKMDSLIARSVTPEIEVGMQFCDDLWLTEIDQSDLEDVVLNLVINARDAIQSHGYLTFETSNCVLDLDYCNKSLGIQPGEYVKLSVSDTGIGMSPEQQEHIFEPFYTTKEIGKGTGLGLSMAYSFAERSGGCIDVFSKPGNGTTFILYLPRTKSIVQAENESTLIKPSSAVSGKAILVVDDEPALLSLAENVLSSHGYWVITATDGSKAMELINNEVDIDLLISDVLMPGDMSGRELAKQALAVRPGLKILLTSGYGGPQTTAIEDIQEFALLRKPYRRDEMLDQIHKLLGP